jgi:hypothetical protein
MKTVSTNIRKITFALLNTSQWAIFVNGDELRHWEFMVGWSTVTFNTLDQAVKYAKEKGMIPKDFDPAPLKNHVEVEVKG